MKGRTTIPKDGTISTELLEHTTLDEGALGRLKKLLARPDLHEDLDGTLQAIQILALLASRRSQSKPASRDALTVIALAADMGLLLESSSFGAATRNDFVRIIHAALEALSGRAMTARDGFRVTEGDWTMRVVRVLDESASKFEIANDTVRKHIVKQAQKQIMEISGREPSTKLVDEALAPRKGRRPKGSKLPALLTSYQAVLTAVGLERPTATALARMRSRYKGKLKT